MYRYTFRRISTGEIIEAYSHAIIPAIASLGIPTADLERLECWDGRTRLWHYENGKLQDK